MNIVFFGSTNESVIVLDKLLSRRIVNLSICCVVTQPPRPTGRHQAMTPTPVEAWAKQHKISVLSFPTNATTPWLYTNEQNVIDTLKTCTPDLLISASYGQKIPTETINETHFGGLNVHPSLLPRWRGADPVPWAILSGDNQTGVTIVTLAENFDEGKIIAQKKIPILPTDTTEILYPKLFTAGADLLVNTISTFKGTSFQGHPQGKSPTPYARRLTKQDGFESWEAIQEAMTTGKDADHIDRKFRALHPWPGLWTLLRPAKRDFGGQANEKRLKILHLHVSLIPYRLLLDTVQLEGKQPVSYAQFSKAYLSP